MTWIGTNRGKRIDFIDPDPNEIDLYDLAEGLARTPRFCGLTQGFYSVAQHSVLASNICTVHPLEALLHDAPEAYMTDVPRPLKMLLGPAWKEIEDRLYAVIAAKFGAVTEIPRLVREVDDILLVTEKRDIQPNAVAWEWKGPKPLETVIVPAPIEMARTMWLARFKELTRG